MTIVLTFVNADGLVKERFLDIVHVIDTIVVTLKKEIYFVLSHNNLSICNIRGQGYDGVSNMGGAWNGLQDIFLRDCPYAYHVHCFAHRLQLALVAGGGNVQPIYCFFSHLNKIVNIVGASPKRHNELRNAQIIEIAEKVAAGARETVLQHMLDEGSSYDMSGEAYDCRMLMKSFNFVFILHSMNKILRILDMLCRSLKQKSLDILNAMDFVSTTKGLLKLLKNDGFDCLLAQMESVCREHDIVIPKINDCYEMCTRRSCQQVDFIMFEHHYRVDVFHEAINTQLSKIDNRFKDETMKLLKLSVALDPKDNFRLFNEGHIYDLADKFNPEKFTDQEMVCLRLEL